MNLFDNTFIMSYRILVYVKQSAKSLMKERKEKNIDLTNFSVLVSVACDPQCPLSAANVLHVPYCILFPIGPRQISVFVTYYTCIWISKCIRYFLTWPISQTIAATKYTYTKWQSLDRCLWTTTV